MQGEKEYRKYRMNLHYVTFMISIRFKMTLMRVTGGEGMPRRMKGYVKFSLKFYA
mgnify:CR=1 FL=1